MDARAELTGAVNTLLLTGAGPSGFNTDVGGIVSALADCGIAELRHVRIVGAGATATSALVAVAELGADQIEVAARRPEAVAALSEIGERLGNANSRAGTHVPLPLSRQQIADVLGLTIETVSRQLTRLRNAGVIDLPSRREIVLQDLPDLEARAS